MLFPRIKHHITVPIYLLSRNDIYIQMMVSWEKKLLLYKGFVGYSAEKKTIKKTSGAAAENR